MRISRVMMVGLLMAAAGSGGCKNSLKDQNASLNNEMTDLRSQLAERTQALDSCNTEKRALETQLAEMRRGGGGAVDGKSGFENIDGVKGSIGAGEVTAAVEGDMLFDSGKTTLKSSAKKSLDQVAGVLNSTYGGKDIRIAGHTDTDPIKKSGFKSNYHLAFERGFAVREYLASKGVAGNRMYLASYGPDVPRGNKQQSRRVEVVVVLN